MKTMSNHDYSISLIRLIATSFIILCHFMQYFDIELAWWFNVGVQIFLCMSGFLYGKRNKISDDLKFYRKNFTKILIDYYVVIIPIILLSIVFIPEKLSKILILQVIITYATPIGGGHLWYIPYCLFCYLITPFLSRYFENSKHIVRRFMLLSILAIIATKTFFNYFNPAWIFCYILGFFLGNISDYEENKFHSFVSLSIIVGAILLNSIQILQSYVLNWELSSSIASLYENFCNYAHVFLGAALFIIFKSVFSRIFKNGYPHSVKRLCSYSDKYSYDIYLVHQFIIFGPFSLMELTNNIKLNLVLIIVIIIVSAVFVNYISTQIKNRIEAVGSV